MERQREHGEKGGDNMKTNKCVRCDNKTFQEDKICVVCKIGLTGIYTELADLLKKGNKENYRTLKAPGTR
jgi:hypothetical protein